ncbi:MAG: glycosyltransferase [Candidatus Omnitrophota bacterium]
MMEEKKFDRNYFENYANNGPYEHKHFLEFNQSVAKVIKTRLNPGKLLDVGCARGFLVSALRGQKISAFGIDISEYAIDNALEDIRAYCRKLSVTDPLEDEYDLITCIEVMEHLPDGEAKCAIANICGHTDTVLFSSSSNFMHPDVTHINQHLPEYWVDLFARFGFELDKNFDAGFISKDAMKFSRKIFSITFLIPGLDVSGGVKVILEYCNNLVQRGHLVNVLSLSSSTPDWFDLNPSVRIIETDQDSYVKLLPISDILIATLSDTVPLVYNAPKKAGQKYYFIQHLEPLVHPGMKFMYAYGLPLQKMTVSKWLKNIIEENTHDRVELVSLGINHEQLYPEPSLRQRYDKKSIRIGMVYSQLLFKGAEDGMKSIALVKKQYKNAKCILMGTQPKPAKVTCDEYWHNPQQQNLNEFYNSCDIFISASWLEGFGLPSLEAMSCKCVVACTDQKGNRDYAINEETALVSPIQKNELLTANIIRLIEDKRLCALLRENAYNKAVSFNWDESAQKMLSFFIRTYKFKKPTDLLVEKLNCEMLQLHKENQSLCYQISQLKKTTSWKITAPIRFVGNFIRKLKLR